MSKVSIQNVATCLIISLVKPPAEHTDLHSVVQVRCVWIEVEGKSMPVGREGLREMSIDKSHRKLDTVGAIL